MKLPKRLTNKKVNFKYNFLNKHILEKRINNLKLVQDKNKNFVNTKLFICNTLTAKSLNAKCLEI